MSPQQVGIGAWVRPPAPNWMSSAP